MIFIKFVSFHPANSCTYQRNDQTGAKMPPKPNKLSRAYVKTKVEAEVAEDENPPNLSPHVSTYHLAVSPTVK